MATSSKVMLIVWLLTLGITQIRIYADQEDFIIDFIGELNRHRYNIGSQPLVVDSMLTKSARWYSEICAYYEVIDHDLAEDYEKLIACGKLTNWYDSVDECLYKTLDNPVAYRVVNGLLNSPPHRGSLLNPVFDHIGLFCTNRNGYSYTVVYVGDNYGN